MASASICCWCILWSKVMTIGHWSPQYVSPNKNTWIKQHWLLVREEIWHSIQMNLGGIGIRFNSPRILGNTVLPQPLSGALIFTMTLPWENSTNITRQHVKLFKPPQSSWRFVDLGFLVETCGNTTSMRGFPETNNKQTLNITLPGTNISPTKRTFEDDVLSQGGMVS